MPSKFDNIVARLTNKIGMSQTPVPGFILGLSGTDSILTFILLYEAMKNHGLEHRLWGIHYVSGMRKNPSWFETDIIPWLKEKYPNAKVSVEIPLGGNQDQQRWADLHLRALNTISYDGYGGSRAIRSRELGENYWVAGCTNATEKALGTYSIMAKSVSMDPIASIYKSEVIDLCRGFGVPEVAIEMSQTPDCLCGRAEIAAHNIKLVDEIIAFKVDTRKYDPEILAEVFAYVLETKQANNFKNRTPFNV